jgi:hypothetical protein
VLRVLLARREQRAAAARTHDEPDMPRNLRLIE